MTFLDFIDVAPYSWAAIGTAAFCGAIIGIERQLRGKPVGIRTSALITLGTYLFLFRKETLITLTTLTSLMTVD